jgi:hypothetical protein
MPRLGESSIGDDGRIYLISDSQIWAGNMNDSDFGTGATNGFNVGGALPVGSIVSQLFVFEYPYGMFADVYTSSGRVYETDEDTLTWYQNPMSFNDAKYYTRIPVNTINAARTLAICRNPLDPDDRSIAVSGMVQKIYYPKFNSITLSKNYAYVLVRPNLLPTPGQIWHMQQDAATLIVHNLQDFLANGANAEILLQSDKHSYYYNKPPVATTLDDNVTEKLFVPFLWNIGQSSTAGISVRTPRIT